MASRTSESFDFIRQQVCTYAPDTASSDYNCAALALPAPTATTSTPSTTALTLSPAPTAPTFSPSPTLWLQPCLVWIVMDYHPEDIGWRITDSVTKEIVVQVSNGTYTCMDDEVVVPIDLIPGRDYRFIIFDAAGNGIRNDGFTGYSVVLGTNLVHGIRLLEGSPKFGARGSRTFTVPVVDPTTRTMTPSSLPFLALASESPTTTSTDVSQFNISEDTPLAAPFVSAGSVSSMGTMSSSLLGANKMSLWFLLSVNAAAVVVSTAMAWF
jgi:hypothetical protein